MQGYGQSGILSVVLVISAKVLCLCVGVRIHIRNNVWRLSSDETFSETVTHANNMAKHTRGV